MAEVIGEAPDAGKKVSCLGCGALIRYYRKDVKEIKVNWDYRGDYERVSAIECPRCKKDVRLK